MWRSEDSSQELVPTAVRDSGRERSLSGVCAKYLCLLVHLAVGGVIIFDSVWPIDQDGLEPEISLPLPPTYWD